MADYILKDSRGKEQTFADDKIFVQGTDGELVQFTMVTGEAVLENLEVTENGTYTPGDGVDGFGSVVVNVDSTKVTILKEQTLTGFAPSSTYGGLYVKELASGTDGVVFDISIGKKYLITWDGIEYTVTAQDASSVMAGAIFMGNGSLFGLSGNNEPFVIGYSNNALLFMSLTETVESHSVGIWQKVTQEITLQDKTITENGTYSADEGFDGLGSVTVDVAGSGGGSLPAGVYWEQKTFATIGNNQRHIFAYKEQIYLWTKQSSTSTKYSLYRYDNGTFTLFLSDFTSKPMSYISIIEYGNVLHFIGGETTLHYTFDGETITTLSNLPYTTCANCAFVLDNTLYIKTYSKGFYKWDESSDTWEEVGITGYPTSYESVHVYNGDVYICGYGTLYKVNWDSLICEEIDTTLPSTTSWRNCNIGQYLYMIHNFYLYKYDLENMTMNIVGYLPTIENRLQLHSFYGRIGIFGINDYAYGLNMIMHEV